MTTQDYSGIVRNIDLAWAAGTATPDAAADYVVFLDATDGAVKRCLVSAIGGGGGAGMIVVQNSGGVVGTRPAIRFTGIGALTCNVVDDGPNSRVNVSYSFIKTAAEDALSSTTPATDKLPYYNSSSSATTTTLSTFARTLLDDADAATARATLGIASSGGAQSVTTIDFGAFPGSSDASLVITGQTGIDTSSVVSAWLQPEATDDHTADEHRVETISVMAGSVVPATGFTIYAQNTSQLNEPLQPAGMDRFRSTAATVYGNAGTSIGGKGTRIYGKWTVAWRWS